MVVITDTIIFILFMSTSCARWSFLAVPSTVRTSRETNLSETAITHSVTIKNDESRIDFISVTHMACSYTASNHNLWTLSHPRETEFSPVVILSPVFVLPLYRCLHRWFHSRKPGIGGEKTTKRRSGFRHHETRCPGFHIASPKATQIWLLPQLHCRCDFSCQSPDDCNSQKNQTLTLLSL